MIIFLTILFSIVVYIVGAGATHGYGKHRWPTKIGRDDWGNTIDANESTRIAASTFWVFYWIFIWPFTKTNEETFSHIEKHAALQIAKNKVRVADLQATRVQLEASNTELEAAEVELEKEMSKL
jgi:hypothetical protein